MTLEQWQAKEARLRKLHTEQTNAGEWEKAQTTRRKLIGVLDAIHRLKNPDSPAKDVAEAVLEGGEDPKRALRNRTQGLGYRPQEIDRSKEKGWNFYIGGPIIMTFDVVAPDIGEAVRRANAVFDKVMTDGAYLNDQNDTHFLLDHQLKPEQCQLTDRNCMMWWELDSEDDPTMNPDFTPEFVRS